MDNIYLKFPTLEDQEKWIEYIKEYRLDNPKAKPLSCTEDINYEEWLSKIGKEHKGIDLQPGRVPSSVYFLMNGDRIVGNLSIRHNIDNDFLSLYGGHIGYSVRPNERRKGYATIMLNLALEKCNELGLEEVMVTCKEDNIGSAKTIENNCGVLKEVIFIPEENCKFKKYWINVKETLEKKKILEGSKNMNVELKRVTMNDIDEIIKMQKESFKPLLDRYHDDELNPYNESYDKVKYKIENYFYYFIIVAGEKVGAIAINDKKDGSKKKIAPIYILPKFQNKGYGQLAMKEVEKIHGETNWKLDTILEEKGNCHLYEKFGYKQTGKFEKISDIQTIVFYEK